MLVSVVSVEFALIVHLSALCKELHFSGCGWEPLSELCLEPQWW